MSYLGQQLGQGQAERFVFTASGGETSVTTSDDGRAVAYTVGQVDVYLNGAKLINGSDFTATTGTSITGLAALTASDVVEVFALSIFQASDTVSAASGGTFNGNVTMAANLSFGDNDKAIFGAGSDLQIYHDGSNSYIDDAGTGALQIRSNGLYLQKYTNENMIRALADGAVSLYYDNAIKLDTTATGIDVTGTVTADGLAVDGASIFDAAAGSGSANTSYKTLTLASGNQSFAVEIDVDQGASSTIHGLTFKTSNAATPAKALTIAANKDISFYEDTGTTPKFFWDASTERLGLGTTSPAEALHIYHPTENVNAIIESGDANAYLSFKDSTTSAANGVYIGVTDGDNFGVYTGGNTARMYINSTGNVGIGTASITNSAGFKRLAINDTSGGILEQQVGGTATGRLITSAASVSLDAITSIPLTFKTGGAEVARLDASGNLLVGTQTSPAAADATAVRYGIGVQAGSLSSSVALTAGTAADVIDLTDVIDGSQNGAGLWLVSIVRDGGSYGTHFVGIFGANNTTATLYETLMVTNLTITVSGTTIRANPTAATDTFKTNVIPLTIGG